jgi:hypothetical protein
VSIASGAHFTRSSAVLSAAPFAPGAPPLFFSCSALWRGHHFLRAFFAERPSPVSNLVVCCPRSADLLTPVGLAPSCRARPHAAAGCFAGDRSAKYLLCCGRHQRARRATACAEFAQPNSFVPSHESRVTKAFARPHCSVAPMGCCVVPPAGAPAQARPAVVTAPPPGNWGGHQ